jgi:tetratricopeptide (TPR) repeat protein
VSGLIALLMREKFLVPDHGPDVQQEVASIGESELSKALEEAVATASSISDLPELSGWEDAGGLEEIADAQSEVQSGEPTIESVDVDDEPELGEFVLRPVDPERRRPDDPVQAAIFDARCRMCSSSPFEVLGLSPGAPLSGIRDARMRMLAKFNAARYTDTILSVESLTDLDAMRQHVDLCARNLVDPVKRGRLERLAGGGQISTDMRGYFAADRLFREGLEQMREGAFKRAEVLIKQAIDEYSNEPEYHTRYAQAVMEGLRSERRFNDKASDAVELYLRQALSINDRFEPALVLLARLRRKRTDWPEALDLYQRILILNPRNVEARKAIQVLSQDTDKGLVKESSGISSVLRRFKKE